MRRFGGAFSLAGAARTMAVYANDGHAEYFAQNLTRKPHTPI